MWKLQNFPESLYFLKMRSNIFKRYLHQTSPLVQLYTSARVVGNIPESHVVKDFSAPLSHAQWCQYHQKGAAPSMLIYSREKVKSAAVWSREHGGCSSDVTLFFAKKSSTKTDRCAGALSWRRLPAAGPPFFWASSDPIAKATNDSNVHLFIHSFTFRDEFITDNALAAKNLCRY